MGYNSPSEFRGVAQLIARSVWDREVEGLSPFTPTIEKRPSLRWSFFYGLTGIFKPLTHILLTLAQKPLPPLHWFSMTHSPESPRCPFSAVDENNVVLSTNTRYWEDCRINNRALAANLRTAAVEDEEPFVPWFAPDDELQKTVALRKRIYDTNPDRVFHGGKSNQQALRVAAAQLLELQADYLAGHFPESYAIETTTKLGRCVINKVTDDRFQLETTTSDLHPLVASGLLGQEDICMVKQSDDGRHIFTAGFVATPTDWELTKFIGKDMDEVHLRFPSYPERLKKVVDDTLTELPEFPAMKYRNNMFLYKNPQLNDAPGTQPDINPYDITDPGSQVFIRTERETLIRLPSQDGNPGDIVFTIKPQVFPLETIRTSSRREKLVAAIRTNTVLQHDELLAGIALGYLLA